MTRNDLRSIANLLKDVPQIKHCVMCGRDHRPNPNSDLSLTEEQKRALYQSSSYSVPPPPVQSSIYWRNEDWINWIDAHGKWNL